MKRIAKIIVTAAASAALLSMSSAVPAWATTVAPTLARASGHRGASVPGVPEETLASMKYADAAGAHALEYDVRWTSDGRQFSLHDNTLDRTTNCTGPGESLTWTQLSACKVDLNAAPYSNTKVPSHEQIVAFAAVDKRMWLNAEVKKTVTDAQMLEFIDVFYDYGMATKTIVSSFTSATIEQANRLDSRGLLRFAQISSTANFTVAQLQDLEAQVYMPRYDQVSAAEVRELQENGIDVWTWGANDTSTYPAAAALKPNVIVTDDPLGYYNWMIAANPGLNISKR